MGFGNPINFTDPSGNGGLPPRSRVGGGGSFAFAGDFGGGGGVAIAIGIGIIIKPILPNPGIGDAYSKGKGERGLSGKPTGTKNPAKKFKPHPTDPSKIIYKDPTTGKTIVKDRKSVEDLFKDLGIDIDLLPKPKQCK